MCLKLLINDLLTSICFVQTKNLCWSCKNYDKCKATGNLLTRLPVSRLWCYMLPQALSRHVAICLAVHTRMGWTLLVLHLLLQKQGWASCKTKNSCISFYHNWLLHLICSTIINLSLLLSFCFDPKYNIILLSLSICRCPLPYLYGLHKDPSPQHCYSGLV